MEDYYILQGQSDDGKIIYQTVCRYDESYMKYYDDSIGAFKNWIKNIFKNKS